MRNERALGEAVAELAARQHGVLTTAQLRAAGLSPAGITRRAGAGRLRAVYRGVYAVGHPGLGNERRWTGAVLACGSSAPPRLARSPVCVVAALRARLE